MLIEKLSEVLQIILSQYSEMKIRALLDQAISTLRQRDANQPALYENERKNLLLSIDQKKALADPRLSRPSVVRLISESEYGPLALPLVMLDRIANLTSQNMTIASTSTEGSLLLTEYNKNYQAFSSLVSVAASLGFKAPKTMSEFPVSMTIHIPARNIQGQISRLADISRDINEMIESSSQYYLDKSNTIVLSHLSMSDLIYYIECAREMAPIVFQVWHAAAELAKYLLGNAQLVSQLVGLPKGTVELETIQKGLASHAENKMFQSLAKIASEAVKEDKSGTVKARLHKTVETVAKRIAEGATLEIETEMEITVEFAPPNGSEAHQENLTHKVAELQRQIQMLIEQSTPKVLLEDQREQ